MVIDKIEIRKVEIPMLTPYVISSGSVNRKETIVVYIYAEGYVGVGETSSFDEPFYNDKTNDICFYVLENFFARLVVGKDIKTPKQLNSYLDKYKGHYLARSAIDFAFWDLLLQKSKKSLKNAVDGNNERVIVGEAIGIQDSVEKTISMAKDIVESGYKRIKLKIKPDWDLDIIKSVRDEFPKFPLMVDANSAYKIEKHISVFKELDNYGLEMIEQPLASDDIVDHSFLQRELKTPICLDESINSSEDARRAMKIKACRIINVKPCRVGGVTETIKINNYAKAFNVGLWCGGMLESGIARGFNISLSSLSEFKYAADMATYDHFYKLDLVKNSFKIIDGEIEIPDKISTGFDVDYEVVNNLTNKLVVID